jgi:glyoxylase I family protein
MNTNITVRHIGITVTDMEKSMKLYKEYFGLKCVWDQIEKGKFIDGLSGLDDVVVRTVKLKDVNGGMIELLNYKSHPEKNDINFEEKIIKIGCSHFAVTVSNLDKTYKELLTMGLKFNAKPSISEDGNAKVCFCRDFDGTLIELVEELK